MPPSPRKKHDNASRQHQPAKEKAKRQRQEDRERGQGAKETVRQKKSPRDEREEENLWRLYF